MPKTLRQLIEEENDRRVIKGKLEKDAYDKKVLEMYDSYMGELKGWLTEAGYIRKDI